MIVRPAYVAELASAVRRSPVTALLGPRQCGKTTLARAFGASRQTTHFDLESVPDRQRLQNPEMALGSLTGLVVLDEIQAMPELFAVLRVIVDRPRSAARFLVLGSASPVLIKGVSETLAGRVEFIELAGFDLGEAGPRSLDALWLRGGFPRSFLARRDTDSVAWREGFIQTFFSATSRSSASPSPHRRSGDSGRCWRTITDRRGTRPSWHAPWVSRTRRFGRGWTS